MRKVKSIGVSLAAVFALSGIAAASASAAPEWFKGNPAVKVKAGEKIPFTGKAGASVLEEKGGLGMVKCAGDTSKGEIEGPLTVVNVEVTYTGCVKGAKKCTTSPPPQTGIIKTGKVKGTNIYLNAAKTIAGILFVPPAGAPFTTFTCEGEVPQEVRGELIGEANPLNGAPANTGTLTFAQEAGKQEWLKIEGVGAEHSLKVAGTVSAGLGGGPKVTEKLVETVTYTGGVLVSLVG
jgi:hypothetical protein